MIIFLILLSILCKSLPWFKNNLSNLSFIRLSCLSIFFSVLLIGNMVNIKNIGTGLYISIELQSFSLYILSSLNKNSIPATGAGLKYFLIGGLASCFILLGIGLIYSSTGLTQFESLTMLAFPNYNSFNLNLIFNQSNFKL